MRELKPNFVKDLKEGSLNCVLEAVRSDSDLDFQIRHNQAHIYYRGGKILDLKPRRGDDYHASFDTKYLDNWKPKPEDRTSPLSAPNRPSVITSSKDAEEWVSGIPQLKRIMNRWFEANPKIEREHQQWVVDQNNKPSKTENSDFWILDIEYAKNIADEENSGKRKAARFDLIAMITPVGDRPPRLAFIEMKHGDKALRPPAGIRSHLKDFHSFLAEADNYKSVKDEMLNVLMQKNKLQVLCGNRAMNMSGDIQAFSDEKPLFVFLLAEHKTKSRILREELSKLDDPSWCELRVVFTSAPKYSLNYGDMLDLEEAKNRA